jgi:hypothetical protein
VNVDGRQVAKATARFTAQELERMRRQSVRAKGVQV